MPSRLRPPRLPAPPSRSPLPLPSQHPLPLPTAPRSQVRRITVRPPGWGPAAYPPPDAGPPKTRWYGWQNLIALGGSLAVTTAGTAAGSAPVALVGVASVALGGPIIHWGHGHVGKGFASLGLTAGLPVAAGLVGFALDAAVDDGSSGFIDFDGVAGFVIGFTLGHVVGQTIDISILAREEEPAAMGDPRYGLPRPRAPRLSLAPSVGVREGGLTLGALGRF